MFKRRGKATPQGARRRRNPFTALICIVLATMLALGATALVTKGGMLVEHVSMYHVELYRQLFCFAQDARPELRGEQGRIESDMANGRGDWKLLCDVLDAGAAMYILDKNGAVVDRYVTDETLAIRSDTVRVIAPPQSGDVQDMLSDVPDTSICASDVSTRPAFLLDEEGNELGAYRLISYHGDEILGGDLEQYANYFAANVDKDYYWHLRSLTGYISPEEILTATPGLMETRKLTDKVKVRVALDYIKTEDEYYARAGANRMMTVTTPGDRYRVLLIYRMLNRGLADAALGDRAREQVAQQAIMLALACVPLLIILIALWVFTDARRRGTHPALWGTLALLGNVVTLIVYLIVRPEVSRCPVCGAVVRPRYVACPMCGHRLSRACERCGQPLRDEWRFCPYCGQDACEDGEESSPSEGGVPSEGSVPGEGGAPSEGGVPAEGGAPGEAPAPAQGDNM